MRLFEFEAKNILKEYGIPIPRGKLAGSVEEATQAANKLGGAVVLKSQILASSRGKLGGIVFAGSPTQAEKAAQDLIGSTINGNRVDRLLVEERLDITRELYASVAIDRQVKTYLVLASTSGGVDIEEVAQTSPEKILKHWVDPLTGFSREDAIEMLNKFDISKDETTRLAHIMVTLYKVATDYDAELVEINPLVRTPSGEFVAADARVTLDDNALFRHPEFKDKSLIRLDDAPLEAEARRQGLAYVDLSGDIGIIGNGAGLVMATLDLVHLYGGRPANFLDIGGGARAEIIKRGVMLVLSKPEVKAVLINILGGITRCDLVAQGVIAALKESNLKKPVAVRMMGTNEEEGKRILNKAGINTYSNLEEAVESIGTLR